MYLNCFSLHTPHSFAFGMSLRGANEVGKTSTATGSDADCAEISTVDGDLSSQSLSGVSGAL